MGLRKVCLILGLLAVLGALASCKGVNVNVNVAQPPNPTAISGNEGQQESERATRTFTLNLYAQDPSRQVSLSTNHVGDLLQRLATPKYRDVRFEFSRPHEWQLVVGVIVGFAAMYALGKKLTTDLLGFIGDAKGPAPYPCASVIIGDTGKPVLITDASDAKTKGALLKIVQSATEVSLELNTSCPP